MLHISPGNLKIKTKELISILIKVVSNLVSTHNWYPWWRKFSFSLHTKNKFKK